MPVGKYKLLPMPQNYRDLTDKSSAVRLTRDIKLLVSSINDDRLIAEMPVPANLGISAGAGYAAIYWDDVADDLRKSLDGARIWKAAAASDDHTTFYENNAKSMLVSSIRTTRYVDVEVAAGDYIYWVQWINLDGIVSGVAGGVTGTVT